MAKPFYSIFLCSILLLSHFSPIDARRGGSMGGSRGSGGRGMSASRSHSSSGSGKGWFGGGGSKTSGNLPTGGNVYHRGTNLGGGGAGAGINRNPGSQNTGGWNNNRNTGFGSSGGGFQNSKSGKGGFLGGLLGGRKQAHSGYGANSHRYSKSGVGSFVRSNQFKNAIVGAAAGYLTYQAGKAIIRAATSPMMWHNRPYYWGSNYYRPGPGRQNMCRMPIESGDQQFGNVYFQDQTRPREIVWGCGYYEYCCGYECCQGNTAPIGGYSISMGYAIVMAFVVRYYIF